MKRTARLFLFREFLGFETGGRLKALGMWSMFM